MPQQHGSKQDIGQDLKAGGQERHEHCRTSHPAQVTEVQRKPRLDENDDECHLPQVGADGEDGRVQQPQDIGTEQDSGEEHANDPGQAQQAAQGCHGESRQENQRKGSEHNKFPPSGVLDAKKADASCDLTNHRSHQPVIRRFRFPAGELHSRYRTTIPDPPGSVKPGHIPEAVFCTAPEYPAASPCGQNPGDKPGWSPGPCSGSRWAGQ